MKWRFASLALFLSLILGSASSPAAAGSLDGSLDWVDRVAGSNRQGNELYRSRMVFRDPYKRPYGLQLPVNTQIPAGQTRTHRVPLKVAAGSGGRFLKPRLLSTSWSGPWGWPPSGPWWVS